jgi:hypothetical protein
MAAQPNSRADWIPNNRKVLRAFEALEKLQQLVFAKQKFRSEGVNMIAFFCGL